MAAARGGNPRDRITMKDSGYEKSSSDRKFPVHRAG